MDFKSRFYLEMRILKMLINDGRKTAEFKPILSHNFILLYKSYVTPPLLKITNNN